MSTVDNRKVALPQGWNLLKYHPLQDKLWRSKAQFVAVAAGRGSGKTLLARRRIVRYLPVIKDTHPDPMYLYALPTIKQAKRVAWKKILQLIPKEWIRKVNITDMTVETIFGSTLHVAGMDRPQSAVEGSQWDGVVIDESCDHQPKVFDLNILPALSEREGWCWRIGVPKRYGRGARDFKRFFDLGFRNNSNNINIEPNVGDRNIQGTEEYNGDEEQIEDEEEHLIDDLQVESYTWPSKDIISPRQLAWAQENLDARDFNEQYNARWESATGAIFHAYSDQLNISEQAIYNTQLPIIIGQDFNVDPMCWVMCHLISDDKNNQKLYVFDELFIRNTNTPASLDELHKRYGQHANSFHFFGDATGKSRKTSASFSDYAHVRNAIEQGKFKGGRLHVPSKNPRVQNRFAACNALFCNAKNERRCLIHPRCKHLRQDLQERQYKEGYNEPDDYGDIGHITDALGYIIHFLFPVGFKVYSDKASKGIGIKIPGSERDTQRFENRQIQQIRNTNMTNIHVPGLRQ